MTAFREAFCHGWVLLLMLACPQAVEAVGVTNLFGNGEPLRVELELTDADLLSLRQDSRKDVLAILREGTSVYSKVAVHLKGSRGSSRPIDDKPSFTLDFAKTHEAQRFHGLRKLHLNNSVEDPGYLNEQLGAELFQAAGVPAPRVGHAVLTLNGRALGLFVVKEGFAEEFFQQFFRNPRGVLYEPGPGHDVNERLQRRQGDGPADQSDLKAVAEAALEPNLELRSKALSKVLDLDRFLSFVAMEIITGHRDGYCLARNNFRLYADPDSGRFVFLPQGMDQLFGNPLAPWRPTMAGLAARSFLELPEGRKRYRERFTQLLTNVFAATQVSNRVEQLAAKIRPVLSQLSQSALKTETGLLQERIAQRRRDLIEQLAIPELQLLSFVDQEAALPGVWRPVDVPEGGRLSRLNSNDGTPSLHISAGPKSAASWRCRVLLGPGKYQFQARAKVSGVEPLGFGRRQGATVRVADEVGAVSGSLLGNRDWYSLAAPISVPGPQTEIELVCELRASRGEVWFDMKSLKLVKLH